MTDGGRVIKFDTRPSTASEVEFVSIVVQHNPFSDVSYVLILLARLSESRMSKSSGENSFLVRCSCTLGRRGECRRQASCLCGEESMKSRSKHEEMVVRGRRRRRHKNMDMEVKVVRCDDNHWGGGLSISQYLVVTIIDNNNNNSS